MMIPLLLLGCAESEPVEASSGAAAADFAGPPGRVIDFVPVGQPTETGISLVILDGAWEVVGTDQLVTSYVSHLGDDGLRVDDQVLLPPRLAEGTTVGGAAVTAVGEQETWYGTFPDTVRVAVDDGAFAGELVFARDVGLVVVVWLGWSGELAYYE